MIRVVCVGGVENGIICLMSFKEKKDNNDESEDVVYFAKTDFRNQDKLFGLKRKDRRQHMYVIGKTGTGKSVLLHNLIAQDIANGEGVCVVDPHGELVESILEKIPESRKKDIVYFNPADMDFHIGFNVLQLPDPKYKHLVASGLMGIFTKLWANVWSARMEYILNNTILALLDTPNTTLLGILRMLSDQDYRQKIIANLKDPVVKAFWVNEYEQWQDKFRNEAIAPIQNKVGQFLSTALVRNIVGQSKSTIDIFELMNERKIFLVNVSKGRIGEDNSALLGAMLITKIQLAAMERVRIPEDERKDFYLYVDEFQNFATDSFAGVLSEARKYRLNLIIAHQYIGQLVTDMSTKVRDAVFGNVGTMTVFRVGAADAEFLESEFEPEFTVQDIVNIPNYHIYIKLMVNGVASRPFSGATLPELQLKENKMTVEEVIAVSREKYARPRAEVEKDIASWAAGGETNESASGASGNSSKQSSRATPSGYSKSGKQLFDTKCSICAKESQVPFEPKAGRPVYCPECYAKIEKGELKPIFSPKTSHNKVAESTSLLAGMGIEFGQDNVKSTAQRRPPQRSGTAQQVSAVRTDRSYSRPLSRNSSNIKSKMNNSKPPVKIQRKSENELGDALKDILG